MKQSKEEKPVIEVGSRVGHITGGIEGTLVALDGDWAIVDLGAGWLKPQHYLASDILPKDSDEYKRIKALVPDTKEWRDHGRFLRGRAATHRADLKAAHRSGEAA